MVFMPLCIVTNERIDGMKRLSMRVLSAALSLILASGCMLSASAFEGRYGDVDGNGSVNSTDALAVLMHAVEKRKLEGDALLRADVDADTEINSIDALQILQFTVGKITQFKAETVAPPEDPKQEVLSLYSDTVNKLHTDIPSYVLKSRSETVDVKLSGNMTEMLSKDKLDDLKEQTKKVNTNNSLFPKGSEGAKINLPRQFATDDLTKFKSVDYELLETGEYKVVISFKDEVNPTKDSMLVKSLGLQDAQTVKSDLSADFDELAGMLGGMATIKTGDVKYTNASVTCVLNPETLECSSYSVSCDVSMRVSFVVTIVIKKYDLNVDMTMRTTNSYSHFEYPVE